MSLTVTSALSWTHTVASKVRPATVCLSHRQLNSAHPAESNRKISIVITNCL